MSASPHQAVWPFGESAERLRSLLADEGWMSSVEADEIVDWIVQALDNFPELECDVDPSVLAAKIVRSVRDEKAEAEAWRLAIACRIDPRNVEWPLRLVVTGIDLLTPAAAAALVARIERLRPSPASVIRAMDSVSHIASADACARSLGLLANWMPDGENLTALRMGEATHELLRLESDPRLQSAAEEVVFGRHLIRARARLKLGGDAKGIGGFFDTENLVRRLTSVRAVLT